MSILVIMIFIVFPFVSLPFILLGITFDKKHSKIYGILLAFILAIIAYNFVPKVEHDLYRYYLEMQAYYSKINFFNFLSDNNIAKAIFKLLQFIFAKIGNFNLLPFFCTFIGYNITFWIILDYSKLKEIKSSVTISIIIAFICSFYHINFMSGLAQYLAISIAFLGFYLEYVKENKSNLVKILYVLPVTIHISTIMFLAFRILLCFKWNKIRIVYFMFLVSYIFLPSVFYQILNIIPGMKIISEKIQFYMLSGNNKLVRNI